MTPTLQIGPLSLLVASALTAVAGSHALGVAQVLMSGGLLLVLFLLKPVVLQRHSLRSVLVVGALVAPAWTTLAVRWAHLDDVLALVFIAATVAAVRRDRALLAGLAVAAACAAKPWAVIALPLLLTVRSGRVRAVTYAALGTAAAWLPFVVADSGTLAALRPNVRVADSSLMWALGYRGTYLPAWDRSAQLLLAPAAALVAVLRGSWAGAILVGIAIRLALDPQDLGYYAASAVLAAGIADLFGRRGFPWLTLGTAVVFWQPFVAAYDRRLSDSRGLSLWWFEHPTTVAFVHLAWAIIAVGVGLNLRSRPRGIGSIAPS